MHILITGHTGFKGAWLSVLLKEKGYKVSGIALDGLIDSLYESAQISNLLAQDFRVDIRQYELLEKSFLEIKPDVVIHLAAQSLVQESYLNPVETYETNVTGTLNVLRAIEKTSSIKAALMITTDKVYKNVGLRHPYKESDPLGGLDPYSSSKAMADILVQSWVRSFSLPPITIARAGNVIGGGDIIPNRLVPGIIKTLQQGGIPTLRYPESIRPWQHVLDCLNGYLTLLESMIDKGTTGEWNFGPTENLVKKVSDVGEEIIRLFNSNVRWIQEENVVFHEEEFLLLDSSKARTELNWDDKLDFHESLSWTVDWYREVARTGNAFDATLKNVQDFLAK